MISPVKLIELQNQLTLIFRIIRGFERNQKANVEY